jgi:hypothetical protein
MESNLAIMFSSMVESFLELTRGLRPKLIRSQQGLAIKLFLSQSMCGAAGQAVLPTLRLFMISRTTWTRTGKQSEVVTWLFWECLSNLSSLSHIVLNTTIARSWGVYPK